MTYVYKVPEVQLEKLHEIKEKTNVPISNHIMSASDIYLKRYEPGGDLYKILDRRNKE
jgi:hypothetical protein